MTYFVKDRVIVGGDVIYTEDERTDFGIIKKVSTMQLTSPIFTDPIFIDYSTKTEGTWVKITGYTSSVVNGMTYTDNTVTIGADGDYKIDVDVLAMQDSSFDRFIGVALAINIADADQALANLTPLSGSTTTSTAHWTDAGGTDIIPLNKNDTVKLFINQVADGSSSTDDINIALIGWSLLRLK